MNIHLILFDAGFALDALLVIYLILLALFKAKRNRATLTLVLAYIAVLGFIIPHAIGVSISDPILAGHILMFHLCVMFIPIFFSHCIFIFLGKEKEQRKAIIASYIVGISLAIFFLLNSRLFLLNPVPKMYLPNYYVAGQYHWLMLAFFFVLWLYSIFVMWRTYLVSNGVERNRIKYFLIALIFGYAIGSTDFLLIYNIPFDPLWGFLFVPFYTIPFTYAALRYELMDIKLVAKNAFVYTITAAVLCGLLIFLNYVNYLIARSSPGFPSVITSVILAMVGAGAIVLVWRKLREGDLLKYEFINVVTHKFRTPLTSIKWSSENLAKAVPEDLRENVKNIQISSDRLVELTSLLVNLSDVEDTSYEYVFSDMDISELLSGCVEERVGPAKTKGIEIIYKRPSSLHIYADMQRIKFVFQTLLDNAISYSPNGGSITVDFSATDSNVNMSVSDTGIGIPKNEIKYIFTKFYRADNGRRTDTEGMGIGLYLSKRIIERHEGKMWVESGGEGKGTTFSISLPLSIGKK